MERFPLPLGALDGLRYFIVALPEHSIYLFCKSEVNYNQYKSARNKAITELRKAKYMHEKDLAANIKTKSKLFWGYVRSKLKTKSAMGQSEGQDEAAIDDNQEKADLLQSGISMMADVLCFGASTFISILGFLVVFNQKTDTFKKEYFQILF